LIGNELTAALISREGSLDWFCAPVFDSDPVWAFRQTKENAQPKLKKAA